MWTTQETRAGFHTSLEGVEEHHSYLLLTSMPMADDSLSPNGCTNDYLHTSPVARERFLDLLGSK